MSLVKLPSLPPPKPNPSKASLNARARKAMKLAEPIIPLGMPTFAQGGEMYVGSYIDDEGMIYGPVPTAEEQGYGPAPIEPDWFSSQPAPSYGYEQYGPANPETGFIGGLQSPTGEPMYYDPGNQYYVNEASGEGFRGEELYGRQEPYDPGPYAGGYDSYYEDPLVYESPAGSYIPEDLGYYPGEAEPMYGPAYDAGDTFPNAVNLAAYNAVNPAGGDMYETPIPGMYDYQDRLTKPGLMPPIGPEGRAAVAANQFRQVGLDNIAEIIAQTPFRLITPEESLWSQGFAASTFAALPRGSRGLQSDYVAAHEGLHLFEQNLPPDVVRELAMRVNEELRKLGYSDAQLSADPIHNLTTLLQFGSPASLSPDFMAFLGSIDAALPASSARPATEVKQLPYWDEPVIPFPEDYRQNYADLVAEQGAESVGGSGIPVLYGLSKGREATAIPYVTPALERFAESVGDTVDRINPYNFAAPVGERGMTRPQDDTLLGNIAQSLVPTHGADIALELIPGIGSVPGTLSFARGGRAAGAARLFHATDLASADEIMRTGLRPGSALTADRAVAEAFGRNNFGPDARVLEFDVPLGKVEDYTWYQRAKEALQPVGRALADETGSVRFGEEPLGSIVARFDARPSSINKTDLLKIADDRGIPIPEGATKAQIVDAFRAAGDEPMIPRGGEPDPRALDEADAFAQGMDEAETLPRYTPEEAAIADDVAEEATARFAGDIAAADEHKEWMTVMRSTFTYPEWHQVQRWTRTLSPEDYASRGEAWRKEIDIIRSAPTQAEREIGQTSLLQRARGELAMARAAAPDPVKAAVHDVEAAVEKIEKWKRQIPSLDTDKADAWVDLWKDQNIAALQSIKSPEGFNRVLNVGRAVAGGELNDPFLTALVRRQWVLEEGLRATGTPPSVVKDAADSLMRDELLARYGNTPAAREAWATIEKLNQGMTDMVKNPAMVLRDRMMNTVFPIDISVAGQQGLAAVRHGGVQGVIGAANRIANALNMPFAVDLYPGMDRNLGMRLLGASDGLQRGISASALNPGAGTVMRYVPGLNFVDRKLVTPVIDFWTKFQFDTILGNLRQFIYEGNLMVAHLNNMDIANPQLRQQAARNANNITSAAETAITPGRAALERVVTISPSMFRSRIDRVLDITKIVRRDSSGLERELGTMMVASNLIFLLGVGKVLNDQIGITDFVMDPTEIGFGSITLPTKDENGRNHVINLFSQASFERALVNSATALAAGDEKALLQNWARFVAGQQGLLIRPLTAVGLGFGYDEKGDFHMGGMSRKSGLLAGAPIPLNVASAIFKGRTDPVTLGLQTLGINERPESLGSEYYRKSQDFRDDKLTFTLDPQVIHGTFPPEVAKHLQGLMWDSLTSDEKDALRKQPGFPADKEAEYERLRRERNDPYQKLSDMSDEVSRQAQAIREEYGGRFDQILDAMNNGPHSAFELRKLFSAQKNEMSEKIDALYRAHYDGEAYATAQAEANAKSEEYAKKYGVRSGEADAIYKAQDDYYGLYDKFNPEETGNWDGWRAAQQAYLAHWEETDPDFAARLRWNMEPDNQKHPLLELYDSPKARELIDLYFSQPEGTKTRYARENPIVDATLWFYGYSPVVNSPEAQRIGAALTSGERTPVIR